MISRKLHSWQAVLLGLLLSLHSPSLRAASTLPAAAQALLAGIKGEWLIYHVEADFLTTRLDVKADGTGTYVDAIGTSPIQWHVAGDTIKVKLLNPPLQRQEMSIFDADGQEQIIVQASGTEELKLQFKKLEGLGTIIWQQTVTTLTTYPENPEMSSTHTEQPRSTVKLVAGRSLKTFRPDTGTVLALPLDNYLPASPDGYRESLSVLGRLDPSHAFTVLEGGISVQGRLFWSVDGGTLRIHDGQGYSCTFRLFEDLKVGAQLLGEIESHDGRTITDAQIVYVDQNLKAQGFPAQSFMLQGCWQTFGADYCFGSDRIFQFTSAVSPDEEPFQLKGVWTVEGNSVSVRRYRSKLGGYALKDSDELLACEKEIAQHGEEAASCVVWQVRSYHLLNHDPKHIAVLRTLKGPGEFEGRVAHIFTKKQ